MEERVSALLTRAGVTFKRVQIIGAYIHIALRSETQARAAAVLFARSHYEVRMFERIIETPHGKRKYGREWKVVAHVKPQKD